MGLASDMFVPVKKESPYQKKPTFYEADADEKKKEEERKEEKKSSEERGNLKNVFEVKP